MVLDARWSMKLDYRKYRVFYDENVSVLSRYLKKCVLSKHKCCIVGRYEYIEPRKKVSHTLPLFENKYRSETCVVCMCVCTK